MLCGSGGHPLSEWSDYLQKCASPMTNIGFRGVGGWTKKLYKLFEDEYNRQNQVGYRLLNKPGFFCNSSWQILVRTQCKILQRVTNLKR